MRQKHFSRIKDVVSKKIIFMNVDFKKDSSSELLTVSGVVIPNVTSHSKSYSAI